MTPLERCQETQILQMNIVDYWYEVDVKGGEGVGACYTEDGTFDGGNKPLVGRAAIEAFYAWRRSRGVRTSRHVICNFRADFHDAESCTTNCVMLLYAADGAPVLPSTPPILICELVDTCVKSDGVWLYTSRTFVPLFQGDIPATAPPAHLADEHSRKG